MALTLVIGNKNYSSWSMRPWIALRGANIDFEEVMISLYSGPEDKQRILEYSAAGKVPVLVDGAITVWDSLAIIEYVAERYPAARLWPEDVEARAFARSVSAEMHSGFMALRQECGMNLRRPVMAKALSDSARENIARIEQIWEECRRRFGAGGPFLFGSFSAADAMYSPVVHRFLTYDIAVTPLVREYIDAMRALPAFRQWTEEGLPETLIIERLEIE